MNAILTYHSIDESGSVLSTAPAVFEAHMRSLADQHARVVPVEHLLAPDTEQAPAEQRLAITFDDGFANFYEHAWPTLQQYDFPATVFIVTDYTGRRNDWPGQPAHIQRRRLLSWSQVRQMTGGGVRLGAHTCTHPDLTRLGRAQVEWQMRESRRRLEDVVGEPVVTFAYPYGASSPLVRDLAAEHFALACTTELAYVQADNDPLALPRLDMYYLRHPVWLRHLFASPTRSYVTLRRGLRSARRQIEASGQLRMPLRSARA